MSMETEVTQKNQERGINPWKREIIHTAIFFAYDDLCLSLFGLL